MPTQKNNYISRFPFLLRTNHLTPPTKVFSSERPDLKSLIDLAAEVVNNFPLPECSHWTVEQVGKWIEDTLGLPQYKECFVRNRIIGKQLILIDASTLPKMNIHNFEDIKYITKNIRALFNADLEHFDTSIYYTKFKPMTFFQMYRAKTGYTYERILPVQFFRLTDIIGPYKFPRCHWYNIDPSKPKYPKAIVATLRTTRHRKPRLFVNQLPFDKVTSFMTYTSRGLGRKTFDEELPSPKSLKELAANAVDSLPLPECSFWSSEQVAEWVAQTLNLPQYKECFVKNNITGKQLISLDASRLPCLKIHDFEHIKLITKCIRALSDAEMESFNQSMTLTKFKPMTMYYLFHSRTGRTYSITSPTEYFTEAQIIFPIQGSRCHWYNVDPSRPPFPKPMVAHTIKKDNKTTFTYTVPANTFTRFIKQSDNCFKLIL